MGIKKNENFKQNNVTVSSSSSASSNTGDYVIRFTTGTEAGQYVSSVNFEWQPQTMAKKVSDFFSTTEDVKSALRFEENEARVLVSALFRMAYSVEVIDVNFYSKLTWGNAYKELVAQKGKEIVDSEMLTRAVVQEVESSIPVTGKGVYVLLKKDRSTKEGIEAFVTEVGGKAVKQYNTLGFARNRFLSLGYHLLPERVQGAMILFTN